MIGFGLIVYASLLILKKPGLSMIPLLMQIAIQCAGSEIFKLIFKDSFIKIFHIYNCSDIVCFIAYLIEFIYIIRLIIKKEQESKCTILNNSLSERCAEEK